MPKGRRVIPGQKMARPRRRSGPGQAPAATRFERRPQCLAQPGAPFDLPRISAGETCPGRSFGSETASPWQRSPGGGRRTTWPRQRRTHRAQLVAISAIERNDGRAFRNSLADLGNPRLAVSSGSPSWGRSFSFQLCMSTNMSKPSWTNACRPACSRLPCYTLACGAVFPPEKACNATRFGYAPGLKIPVCWLFAAPRESGAPKDEFSSDSWSLRLKLT